ncbi:tripartite ATP-independent transporter DctP family solute receptor [Variovorax boronicumulans]|jgi:tripartite ATP-independent transporter DctP family solute receptor|uniref:Tripartite ATP-independent transporter DctP family solute receptor n=1 Tax=Variovorax boronicumulans TaxID=436515 RepID=A0AAW8CW37_9BURK|nr:MULTISPECIES: TRAP transporter substrate-binding protein [Variovorax]MCR6475215.1 TRAP transporter substrate-binding protein [Variovorax sp. ZS18.2.2]MDP9894457.1 tripartite ATP-independent transporter DctP family solute receptor [Variovorax boronicumulans]MDP9992821.1 tripartite ATP-independent transporter DctP family solute receptor [Variovorax boronicumulans]MDQ0004088.1 tripartite ATP-independent transporter DctP family solute receptor [Variovorax boronicumulans]MDQ0054276.1 tripartite 
MKLGHIAAACLSLALGTSALAQQPTVLKIGYATSKESHYGVGSTVFCDEVEKGTQGRFKCQHFANSALGGEREQIEAIQLGTQDLVNTSTGPVGNFVPEVKIVDIPFLFRDYDHARKVMDGPIGQDILTKFPSKGIIALAWTENGFRHMTNSKRDIVKPSDAAGLKMRTMENKVHMDGYRTFGILPTPMAFPELFGALQQGTVDGQENPIPVILASKFSQVQKHLSLTGHVYSPALLLLSPKVWNKLSDADKKVFVDAAKKAAVAQRKKVNDDENNGIAQLEKDGMKVTKVVDGAAFREALKPAYAGYAKEFGADNIKKITDVQ